MFLFETPQTLPADGLLQKADTSCLVMIRENKEKLLLTVSQPDLALYRGPSDEAFDKDGKRIERSIYSRPWIDDESGENSCNRYIERLVASSGNAVLQTCFSR